MYKIALSFLLLFAAGVSTFSQPGSEIYLFDLKIKGDRITLSKGRNITNHKGYDNQPFFHPEKPLLYFVSADDKGRTDIFEYNLKTKKTNQLTKTNEREYSPTVTPDNLFLSCILQRDSGEQDLVKYPIQGGTPAIIIDSLVVGYHAWADDNNVFIFVLGEPNTLRVYSVQEKKAITVAENIGRSIHKIPGENEVSFIHKVEDKKWVVKSASPAGAISWEIIETLEGREFLTWTPDGKILMSDDKKIFFTDTNNKSNWKEVTINSETPLNTITRLAVDSKNKVIAVVVNE
jgi:hypothetical protein